MTTTPDTTNEVPRSLRTWFVVHFIADIVFAIPLIVAPRAFAALVGYEAIDPVTARMVGAALVGIGTESLLGRNDSRASFLTMLRLKVLWSATANVGLALSLAQGAPTIVWALLAIFVGFCALWTRYWLLLRKSA